MMQKPVDLSEVSNAYTASLAGLDKRIVICAGTGCVANGALKVYQRFVDSIVKHNLPVVTQLKPESEGIYLSESGCQGFCQKGPLVTILPENILYTHVKPEDVDEIVLETLLQEKIVKRLLYHDPVTGECFPYTDTIPFYQRQHRFVLQHCGLINPESIQEYIALGGYESARRACTELADTDICQQLTESGLRGRGGGGFPTGKKWDLTRVQPTGKKYVICNGDEGDPGAFMDRSLMEGNPHSVLEGMIIAARAVGADEGYVYVRMEYPLAVKRMRKAVHDAREKGILGNSIFGSRQNFDITVMEGAGAFVCGEETALIASIEGKRGMPSPKPPYPAESGLFGKPTVINNVETLATVPLVFSVGVNDFKKIGTPTSSGTKTFALTGHVANTGLIEVPFGTTLRHIVDDIAGGVVTSEGVNSPQGFKAVQIGGPSGGCLTKEHLDLPLDFDALKSIGAMVGSGGLVVMNSDTCMVNIARFFMQFTQNESCGKCTLCREGTKQMLVLLDDIIQGRATGDTLNLLEELARAVKNGALCGLGKTAPNPILSTLKYFRDEYEAHVFDKKCPSGACKSMIRLVITPDLCKGCGICSKKCPVDAISGDKGQPFRLDQEKCIKCMVCVPSCKFKAIIKV